MSTVVLVHTTCHPARIHNRRLCRSILCCMYIHCPPPSSAGDSPTYIPYMTQFCIVIDEGDLEASCEILKPLGKRKNRQGMFYNHKYYSTRLLMVYIRNNKTLTWLQKVVWVRCSQVVVYINGSFNHYVTHRRGSVFSKRQMHPKDSVQQ